MGICSSCLGRDRKSSQEDENSRLLYDDPHAVNYSSFGDQAPGSLQADPQDVQRETEALQRIVAQTSNHLVDIFAMIPQSLQRSPATTFSGQDTRLAQYQDVMARLPADNIADANGEVSAQGLQGALDWPSDDDDDDEELKTVKVVKSSHIGPLLGGFADVERNSR